MRTQVLLVLLFFSLGACARNGPEARLVRSAAAAMGGAEKVTAIDTLLVEGKGNAYNLGQNRRPGAPLPRLEITEYRRVFDFSNKRWRETVVRIPQYVTPDPDFQRLTTAVDNSVGFDVAEDGLMERLSDMVGSARNVELYHHPVGILQAAMDPRSRLSNFRAIGNELSVDIATFDGGEFTLYVDESTGLPSRVRSMGYYPQLLGDVILETQFEAYENVNGVRLPTQLTSMLDRYVQLSIRITNTLNVDAADLEAPDNIKSALAPIPAPRVDTQEIGRGLWYLTGQSHNSVVVEFRDHLMLIEAPQDDVRTLAVIGVARQLSPEKPLTQVVNTHHHFDHAGGIRAAVAEGLTVITHEANRDFYEASAARSHRLSPDALERNPRPIQIEGVSEPYVLDDNTRRVEIYPVVGSRHADTLLMVYLPAERALVVADVYSTPDPNQPHPRFPYVDNLLENIRNYGLRVDRVLPIHGQAEPFSSVTRWAQIEARTAGGVSE